MIDEGKFSNVIELSRAVGKDYAYVGRILRLTLLAPDIVHAALTGTLPEGVGVEHLRKSLPVLWSERKQALGMEEVCYVFGRSGAIPAAFCVLKG